MMLYIYINIFPFYDSLKRKMTGRKNEKVSQDFMPFENAIHYLRVTVKDYFRSALR
jgi:hypothetical protein